MKENKKEEDKKRGKRRENKLRFVSLLLSSLRPSAKYAPDQPWRTAGGGGGGGGGGHLTPTKFQTWFISKSIPVIYKFCLNDIIFRDFSSLFSSLNCCMHLLENDKFKNLQSGKKCAYLYPFHIYQILLNPGK